MARSRTLKALRSRRRSRSRKTSVRRKHTIHRYRRKGGSRRKARSRRKAQSRQKGGSSAEDKKEWQAISLIFYGLLKRFGKYEPPPAESVFVEEINASLSEYTLTPTYQARVISKIHDIPRIMAGYMAEDGLTKAGAMEKLWLKYRPEGTHDREWKALHREVTEIHDVTIDAFIETAEAIARRLTYSEPSATVAGQGPDEAYLDLLLMIQ